MNPMTNGFCARAMPVRPRAAAPAAPARAARRPILNLSTMLSLAPIARPVAAQGAGSKLCASPCPRQECRFRVAARRICMQHHRIAFFLGRFDNDENLYIHNDESYIDDGFYQNPAQIISEKEFKVKAVVNANHANNLIVWMEIQNIKNDHPKITIIKVERENNDC